MTRDRERLLNRYRDLVLHRLPDRARREAWVVTQDHCFGRIVLDTVVEGRWYDVLDRHRSPAFAQLDDAQLQTAVDLAERMLREGDSYVRRLNARSLAWRRTARRMPPRPLSAEGGSG